MHLCVCVCVYVCVCVCVCVYPMANFFYKSKYSCTGRFHAQGYICAQTDVDALR